MTPERKLPGRKKRDPSGHSGKYRGDHLQKLHQEEGPVRDIRLSEESHTLHEQVQINTGDEFEPIKRHLAGSSMTPIEDLLDPEIVEQLKAEIEKSQ